MTLEGHNIVYLCGPSGKCANNATRDTNKQFSCHKSHVIIIIITILNKALEISKIAVKNPNSN